MMSCKTCRLHDHLNILVLHHYVWLSRAGPAPRLAYIDEEDIRSERVRVRTDEERAGDSEFNIDPDADDMALLKHRPDMAPAQRMVITISHPDPLLCHCGLNLFFWLCLGHGWP